MFREPFASALVLTGPTGSGKSALALELAPRLDAEIVSMDSMSLYRRLDIGTAKPTLDERARVPHHLIDVLDPWESASVAWWLERAEACCCDIVARGKQVLFVGGTPLYLKALTQGLFDGPPADPAIRQRLAEEANRIDLHERLANVDAASARRLHPNDQRRIIRALEVFELTGRPISDWQTQWGSSVPEDSSARCLWLDLPREVLYDRIDRRVVQMFDDGLIDEVRGFQDLEKPLSPEAAQAVGYRETARYLAGECTRAEAIRETQTRTRNFAKRQITWFRHLPGCRPVSAELTESLWTPKMSL